MTYRQLADAIEHMDEEQQTMDISVEHDDEIYGEIKLKFIKENDEFSDVLDVGHPVLVVG